MGHSVLMTRDIRKTLKWYRENFGFVSSDDVYAGPKENIVGSFNRSTAATNTSTTTCSSAGKAAGPASTTFPMRWRTSTT